MATVEKEGIVPLSALSLKTYNDSISALVTMIKEQTPQDIFISSGETIEIKIKGRLTEALHLNAWTTDVFDFFLGNICKKTIKGRAKPNSKSMEMDYGLTNALLEKHGTSYDFSMSLNNQTLRVH